MAMKVTVQWRENTLQQSNCLKNKFDLRHWLKLYDFGREGARFRDEGGKMKFGSITSELDQI